MNTFLHNIKKRLNKHGREPCRHCETRGIITIHSIDLRGLCHHCKGEGSLDWITHIRNVPSPENIENESLRQRLLMDNVYTLVSEIKSLLYKEGMTAAVDVRILQDDYNHRATDYLPLKYNGQLITDQKYKKIISM